MTKTGFCRFRKYFCAPIVALCLFAYVPEISFASTQSQDIGVFYSPDSNLEQLDIREISLATRTIDIAMYSFTDRNIGNALLAAADRGVIVRIYRDKTQILDRNDQTKRMLINPNIHVRIKNNNRYNIMHLKAYVIDGEMLREGSANWSPAGEGAWKSRTEAAPTASGTVQQDNTVVLTTDPESVMIFRKHFERLWNREDNIRNVGEFLSEGR